MIASAFPLSDGEVNFLYWFIQGSIMFPETRRQLRASWGFCERHAWAHLAVETGLRNRYVFGPAILYEDLLGRALRAFALRGPFRRERLARRLSSKQPCMMCESRIRDAGRGVSPISRIERGRSVQNLAAFARDTSREWAREVCGRCGRPRGRIRCRPHLLEELSRLKSADLDLQHRTVTRIHERLRAFSHSFVWEHRGTDGPEERASIFSAIGWLSGWGPLLQMM